MSLISDPDFLIHTLRVNYLRNVEDPYGPRIISLDPSYQSNPYTATSGYADVERWPELAMPSSPIPSDEDEGPNNRPTRHLGATGLKYTTTIMGPSRVGAMGLRVSGKRTSTAKPSFRLSVRSESDLVKRSTDEQDREPAPAKPSSASPVKAQPLRPDEHASLGNATLKEQKSEPLPAPVQFVPKFKGAAEMEARRRQRMLARTPPGMMNAKPAMPAGNLDPEASSSESSSDNEGHMPDEEEDYDLAGDVDDSMDMDGDEFDPAFTGGRGNELDMGDDASDGMSVLSGSMLSSSGSSIVDVSLQPESGNAIDAGLSPISEGGSSDEEKLPDRPEESAPLQGFEMVMPAPKALDSARISVLAHRLPATSEHSSTPPDALFARKTVAPRTAVKSALTQMLASSTASTSSNPFAELYSAIAARVDGESMLVRVYLPWARKPAGRPLELKVRKDATVEEVLGFALWTYWEDNWLPKIDEGLEGEEDPRWAMRCSAVGWILRIAEEDGEVDEDFPPPERNSKISKFNFDAYAVLEATPAQVQQNKVLDAKIQRRLSRIVIKKKKSAGLLNIPTANGTLIPPGESLMATSAGLNSLGSSVGFPSSLGPSMSQGPPIYLRCIIADTADAGHFKTTVQVSGGMYMQEVLELVCQKRKLSNDKDYALILDAGTKKVLIPLDRTVRSLQDKRELILVRKSMLPTIGVEMSQGTDRNTDPNASILKRSSEVPEQSFSPLLDYTNAYKKYTVYRKMPVLVGRNARLLAIDGGYIHIMPLANKTKHVFESGKTSSYHLKSLIACQQSSKNSSTFKFVVHSDGDRNKRYEFEAEDPKMANEIVQTIRSLKSQMERPGTIKGQRRSKHVTKDAAHAYLMKK